MAHLKKICFLNSLGRSPQPSASNLISKPASGSVSSLPNGGSSQTLPSAVPTRLSLNLGQSPGLSVLSPHTPKQARVDERGSGSSLSNNLDKFRAPAPSPPASSSLKVAEKSSISVPEKNPSISVAANKPQFKPKFQVPTKSGNANSSMIDQSQLTQEQNENVETLLEGLDEDSIFGDF